MNLFLKTCIIFVLICSANLASQNLLNLPESVVYDSLYNRYLVSNWGSGNVVQIDSTGTQSIFLNNQQCFAGLHIIDSILYVACREYGVKGFNLNTGENVLNVNLPGIGNINDITSDNSGNLFVSHVTGDAIYKVNIASGQYWIFVDENLDYPNGLCFDEENNRLILVSYRMNSVIQEISLTDSTVSLITYPGLHNLDGISRDNEGNYYVSSWYTNAVYKFDEYFLNPPVLFSTHNDDPADIFYDTINNVLAVPLFFTHQVEFIEAGTSNNSNVCPISETILMQNYPNPFNPSTTISFELNTENTEAIELMIYNLKGQKIRQFSIFNSQSSIIWDGTDHTNQPVSSGIYYSVLKQNDEILASKKMMLIK